MEVFSPLRYPGGKAKLAPFVQMLFDSNSLGDGYYVEPFAGGASVALSLLFNEYVKKIFINDIDRSIYAFWHSVLNEPEEFCRRINKTPLSIPCWRRQKAIQKEKSSAPLLDLGFSTFYLNRTNRSGVLNAGVIGGLDQKSEWKIDARFNRKELIKRVERIASYGTRIEASNLDACDLIGKISKKLIPKTLIYFDPPYYVKGSSLYHSFFRHEDHEVVSDLVRGIDKFHWVVSYDNAPEIRRMYRGFPKREYSLDYCVSGRSTGEEVMFFSKKTLIPRNFL